MSLYMYHSYVMNMAVKTKFYFRQIGSGIYDSYNRYNVSGNPVAMSPHWLFLGHTRDPYFKRNRRYERRWNNKRRDRAKNYNTDGEACKGVKHGREQ
jgi:hypothetical protein